MSNDARTPEEIERDIQRERAQLASSLEALQERFSIEGITRQVTEQLKRHGGEFGQSALESAKSNPVALALTGIGLAWMMASDARRNGRDHGSTSSDGATGISTAAGGSERWDRMRSATSRNGHRVRASAEDLRKRLHEGTEHLSETARKRVVEAREAAHRAQSQMESAAGNGSKQLGDYYSEQPLVAGAMAFAVGAAAGAFLPHTKAEDSALGDTSDKLFEEAERIFREETDKAKEAVNSASSVSGTQGRQAQTGSAGGGSGVQKSAPGGQPKV